MNTVSTRWVARSTAGARKPQTCQTRIGSTIAIAASPLTLTAVVKGSTTPSVTSVLSAGSGRISHSISVWWNAKQSRNAGMIAATTIRSRWRSSVRCSTTVASSSVPSRRGASLRIILVRS